MWDTEKYRKGQWGIPTPVCSPLALFVHRMMFTRLAMDFVQFVIINFNLLLVLLSVCAEPAAACLAWLKIDPLATAPPRGRNVRKDNNVSKHNVVVDPAFSYIVIDLLCLHKFPKMVKLHVFRIIQNRMCLSIIFFFHFAVKLFKCTSSLCQTLVRQCKRHERVNNNNLHFCF